LRVQRRLYGVFKCKRCGRFNLAKSSQKTKTCAYCGVKNRLSKLSFIAYASNPREAAEILRKLKTGKA